MNDFTKEELSMLKRLTLQDVNQFRQNSDCIELMGKIQSMIDNFEKPCSHKNCRRVSLLDGHDYDICPNCEYIRQMR